MTPDEPEMNTPDLDDDADRILASGEAFVGDWHDVPNVLHIFDETYMAPPVFNPVVPILRLIADTDEHADRFLAALTRQTGSVRVVLAVPDEDGVYHNWAPLAEVPTLNDEQAVRWPEPHSD